MQKFRAELTAFIAGIYEGEKKVLVFGEGTPGARVMLIGEAPGERESLEGRPFVGKAGKNLDSFIEGAGLDRGEMYVTNAVKFRPARLSEAGNLVNRPPTREEIALFKPWLEREIALVKPRVIVTLGNVPLKALTGGKNSVGLCHGALSAYKDAALFPMYHPASLIYNRALEGVYAEDMRSLAEILKNYPKINC